MEDEQLALGTPESWPSAEVGAGCRQVSICLEGRSCGDWGETETGWERAEKRDPVQLMCLVLG